ncbi:MAG: right-handed parallel beta-helix repeat-containing protein [Mariniphaga sp.]
MKTDRNVNVKGLLGNSGLLFLFLSITLILLVSFNRAVGQEINGRTYVVAPGGSDSNLGTTSQPMATFEAARDAARTAGKGNHRIIVLPGEYYLTRPFELDWRDNGLTIEADTTGKVILYGGTLVTGWKREGEKLWYADLPGVKEGTWDFRALVVDGRMPERARMPESGTLTHLNNFDVPWLSSIAGGWARQPTTEELTTMRYDPKDIPENLDIVNAEVRVYHMWDESLVGIARNDIQNHKLTFTKPTIYPPGGFGKKDYIIWNTREGMSKPGRWYLDRTVGRLVYWPLEGEDMAKIKIIAPKMERIIRIAGTNDKKVENITILGLSFQGTTIPFKSAGMGATSFDGALSIEKAVNCTIEKLKISNVGGIGISAKQLGYCHLIDCQIYNIGGAGAKVEGDDLLFARNHIHNVGIYYPGAVGLSSNGSRNHIYRNEIHDAPYSGMIVGKTDILIEENLIYRVMREIHDGAAIYTFGVNNCILRGNVARDITTAGSGYGVSSYYLDEGSYDCIVEKNTSIGVARPIHNHIARNSIIRDNVFITNGDMTLSFQSSAKFSFENNTLITPGTISIISPNAITSWKGNRIFSNGVDKNNQPQASTIDSVMPYTPSPARKTMSIKIPDIIKVPTLDGELAPDEWSGVFQRLDREP